MNMDRGGTGFLLLAMGLIGFLLIAGVRGELIISFTVLLAGVGMLLFPIPRSKRSRPQAPTRSAPAQPEPEYPEPAQASSAPSETRHARGRDRRPLGFALVAVGVLAIGGAFAFSCDSRAATGSRASTCVPVTGWPVLAVFQSGALVQSNGLPTSLGVLGGGALAFLGAGLLLFGKSND